MIVGNWKMHKTAQEAKVFIDVLEQKQAACYLAVPYPCLQPPTKHVQIGAQNVSEHTHGAYTGEVSAQMIAATGATFTLIGHSERRHIFGETDAVMAEKIARAREEKLLPILCVGETESERQANETEAVLKRQLAAAIRTQGELVVAYEPVWAIGTGKTATPEMAQSAHAVIRTRLAELVSPEWAAKTTILYGGSVKPSNAKELLSQPDIGGALVGGASLEVESFYQITQG